MEDQFTKALTEMDADSKMTLHMENGKDIIIVHQDLLSIGAETVKIVRRLNERTNRGKVRIIPYEKIDYITFSINEEIYEGYKNKCLPASEVTDDNIPTEDNNNENPEPSNPQEPSEVQEDQDEPVPIGEIMATVTDNHNDMVRGATITLSQDNELVTYTGVTDENGSCTLEDLPYGEYNVEITAPGYETYTNSLTLDVDLDMEDFTIIISEVDENEEEDDFVL